MTASIWIIFIIITIITALSNSLRQLYLIWGNKKWSTIWALIFYMVNNVSLLVIVAKSSTLAEGIAKALVQGLIMGLSVLIARLYGDRHNLCKEWNRETDRDIMKRLSARINNLEAIFQNQIDELKTNKNR